MTEVKGTPERLLHIATSARPKTSDPWKQHDPMTWESLLRRLKLDSPAAKRECGGIVGGLLRDGKRDRAHVVSRSLLTLDADEAKPDFLADIERVLPGVAALAHTTYSNGPKGSRYRLYVPLSRGIDGARYQRLAESVRDALGDHWDMSKGGDQGCPEPERFMYRPSTQNQKYHYKVFEGEPLDVDAWSQDEPEPESKPKKSPAKQQATEPHPWVKKAVEGELARLDECNLMGWSGPKWNQTTLEVVNRLVKLANNPRSGYTLDQAEADFLEHAPSDEGCVQPGNKGFGPEEHEAMWADAVDHWDGEQAAIPGDDDFAEAVAKPKRDVTNLAETAEWLRHEVGRQGTPLAGLFRRGGGMVYTPRIGEDGYVPLVDDDERNEDGPAQVRPMIADGLRARVNFSYDIVKMSKPSAGEPTEVEVTFPLDPAKLVYNAVDMAPNLRPLAGVTHTPMLRKDGSVLSEEGYDEESARLYLPDPGMAVLPVPDVPTTQQVEEARDLISLMITDFPFVTEHDRANYLALLFTPLLRLMVPPPYPLGLIHAHQPSSGKGYMARILRTLHGGVLRPLPGTEEEMRKQVLSILATTTAPIVQFDNVLKLKSPTLDGLLTSATWTDRVLGVSADFTGKNDRLWIATGNNVAIGGDLLRRLVWVNIDPGVSNPELRTDFAIPNLPEWVRDRRGELLTALLTLLRAWVNDGSTLGPKVRSDDYSAWTQAVQGILAFSGWTGTVNHSETIQEASNDDQAEWGAFLAAVWEESQGKPCTVKTLLEWLDPDDLPEFMDANSTRSVGKCLKNRVGQWAGGYVLRKAGTVNNTVTWQVETQPKGTSNA